MGTASSSIYLPEEETNIQNQQNQADTNVICIGFSILKESQTKLVLGDPKYCIKCQAILNVFSNIETDKKIGDQCQTGIFRIWKCEFCNTINSIDLEPEEYPNKNDVIYLLENAAKNIKKGIYLCEESLIIFRQDIQKSLKKKMEVL